METKKGSSLLETRRRNRVLLKDIIFNLEPVTRTAAAKELGLTLPTVTTSVNEMIEEGILEEVPVPEEKLKNNAGRKPVAIQFVAGAAVAVGVDIGPYATRIVLVNLRGEILDSCESEPGDSDYSVMIKKLAHQIETLIKSVPRKKLLGVGIGLPGFIEPDNGIIRSHREKDWVGRNLAGDMEEMLHMPVIIDNNVRIRAVGYEMAQKGRWTEPFAYLYISRGIACPFMTRGSGPSLYSSGAGELGHTILSMEEGGEKNLDQLAGEKAIRELCQKELEMGRALVLAQVLKESGQADIDMKLIGEAQQLGDPQVKAILEKAIDYIGLALANVVNLLNPRFVVVDGYMMKSENNRKQLQKATKKRFFGINEEEVQMIFLPFDHFSGAKSAGLFAIRQMFLGK